MKNLMIVAPLLLAAMACQEDKPAQAPAFVQEQTPAALDENKSDYSIMSKRYQSDIILDLYLEAMQKNPTLEKLNDRLTEIREIKNDSLKAYNKYLQNNREYWINARSYINQLSDSTTKREMRDIFKTLENKYNTRISKHTQSIEELESRTRILHDRELLMLLVVTEPMMNNYQRNELPKVSTLDALISRYDSLIKDTQKFTELKK